MTAEVFAGVTTDGTTGMTAGVTTGATAVMATGVTTPGTGHTGGGVVGKLHFFPGKKRITIVESLYEQTTLPTSASRQFASTAVVVL